MSKIANEVGDPVNNKIILYGDNTGSIAIAKNPEFHQKTKHIALKERYVNDLILNKKIRLKYVPTSNMLADVLTKPLPKERHINNCGKLGLDLKSTNLQYHKRKAADIMDN